MRHHSRLSIQYVITFILTLWVSIVHSLPEDSTSTTTPLTQNSQPPVTLANKNYLALKTELARYQTAAQKTWELLSEENKFKPGKHYPEIPLLRERLQLTGDFDNPEDKAQSTLYDKSLVKAVKRFQQRHDLQADGVIGTKTFKELNVTPEERIKTLQINMGRWALLSKQLGDRFIIVNIPDYELYLFDNGNQVLMMHAIVGKPDWQTPELNSRITRIVYNPYWHVPDTIAANDLVPKVKNDPYYLEDMHIKVYVKHGDQSERRVNRDEIDWESVQNADSPYSFRQEPGDDNALGLVKFEFPNPYDVYLHDTPVKSLFEQPERDLSHGCVRLEKPLDLANYLMKDNPEWNELHTQELIDSHKTTSVRVSKPMPIYITYITAWADENGIVNYRNDIYARDVPANNGDNKTT